MQNSPNRDRSEIKCNWMSAGIINHKLCDRNFKCEQCEFDTVMRGSLPNKSHTLESLKNSSHTDSSKGENSTSHLLNRYLYSLFFECKIHLNRYYHPSHFWFKVESEDIIQVGINKLLIKILEPIDKIILPAEGETYCRGQLTSLIVRKGKTLPLHIPFIGKVVDINKASLQDNVKKITEDDTYFFKMAETGISHKVKHLCSDILGLFYFTENIHIVTESLTRAIESSRPVEIGTTLPDGGHLQIGLEKVIGEQGFQNIVKRLFNLDSS